MSIPAHFDSLDDAVDFLLARVPGPLCVGLPLGLGKPHRLINALYARCEQDPSRPVHFYTALSLDPPAAGAGLQRRFLEPFLQRHFGVDFPRLRYVEALKRDAVPLHIRITEFYLQSGALLDSTHAQRHYASLNYTHVAAALADRGMNVLLQRVAREPGGTRLSLSCNTDLTFDALDALAARGLPRPLLLAEVDPELPWLDGSAAVDAAFFDAVVMPPPPYPKLFGLPRQPVSDADYAIGFHASTLVRDGGTLQIGIGTLADALSHALALRHTDNAAYRRVLGALGAAISDDTRDSGPFVDGLYGCSEMLNEGFRRLVEVGVIKRKVVDDEALLQRLAEDRADDADWLRLELEGQFLHGAFYLGSHEFYDWLRTLPEAERRGIVMKRVSEVNELYGGREALERLQRRDARFFNSCMMATVLGAAVSDGLADGRVVSGVGGQYNFVAMAHALPDARSALMFRASREAQGRCASNLVWNYGHATIPRHLRDIYITEYGIADVRGRSDEDCIVAMLAIADARFQDELLRTAQSKGKLRSDYALAEGGKRNTPQHLHAALAPFRADGTLPDYPLGSDFTAVEQRLVRALAWLKANTATRQDKVRTLWQAVTRRTASDHEALARMGFDEAAGWRAGLEARLLSLGLERTRR